LEYVPFSNGTVKHVIPILSIVDDTHLTAEYIVAEIGASSFNPSGAYHIYKGGMVSSLAAPPSGSPNPLAVNLSSGGTNFQVGDTIQQPLGYNYHGAGVQVVVSSLLTPTPGSAGIKINNVGTSNFGDALFINGNFDNLIRTGSTFTDSIIKTSTPYGCFFKSSDTSAVVQTILQVLNGSLTARNFTYDRPNDWWRLGGMYFDAASTHISTNSTPQTNVEFYLGYAGAATNGLLIAPTTAPNAGVFQLGVQNNSGNTVFGVDAGTGRVLINNSTNLDIYAGNLVSRTVQIVASTGNINTNGSVTAGAVQISAGTPITKSVVYTPSLSPAAVAANTTAVQVFTVTGLTTSDIVIVNPVSALGAGLAMGACWVSAADTLAILFINVTAGSLTPIAASTYRIHALRA
jgi:hypothetical protein